MVINYTNQSIIESMLGRSLTTSEKNALPLMLPAVKIFIDKKAGSNFSEVEESTRYFDGGSSSIDVDPCTAISAIASVNDAGQEDYTYTDLEDYVAEPQNSVVTREIVRRGGCFPTGLRRMKVTAKFSEYYKGVPEDIRLLASQLIIGVFSASKVAGQGNKVSESLEGHSITWAGESSFDKVFASNTMLQGIIEQRREIIV
jgi:hypothetical protein